MKKLLIVIIFFSNSINGMNAIKKCSASIIKKLTPKAVSHDSKKIFFNAPWRGKYITAATKSLEQSTLPECKLCYKHMINNDEGNYIIERQKSTYLALARFPYHKEGHVLVMPYKHTGSLEALDASERAEMVNMISYTENVFAKHNYHTFMGFNIGRDAGAGIPGHLHGHVIPYTKKKDTILHSKDEDADLAIMYACIKQMFENAQKIPLQGPQEDKNCSECAMQKASLKDNNYMVKQGMFNYIQLEEKPFTVGHLNIVPFKHVNNLEQMSDEMRQESFEMVIHSCKVLACVVKANNFNIGFHNRTKENHFKWHVIPRHQGDVSCTESVGNIKVLSRSIEQLYQELCEQFKK